MLRTHGNTCRCDHKRTRGNISLDGGGIVCACSLLHDGGKGKKMWKKKLGRDTGVR